MVLCSLALEICLGIIAKHYARNSIIHASSFFSSIKMRAECELPFAKLLVVVNTFEARFVAAKLRTDRTSFIGLQPQHR